MNFDGPALFGAKRQLWLRERAGGCARQGWALATIAHLLLIENQARCSPPLEHEEVDRIARAEVEYETLEAGHRDAAFKRFDRVASRRARLELLDDIEIETLPQPEWLVDRRLPTNGLALMFGSPGVGKSFVALDCSLAIASGFSWHGAAVRQGAVIYVAAEGVGGLKVRVQAWKRWNDVSGQRAGVLFLPTAIAMGQPDDVTDLINVMAPHSPVLVVLDTLARCMVGLDEDTAKDMGLFIEAADRIRTCLKTCVLALHHPTKDQKAERGSGALRGAFDTVLRLRGYQDGRLQLDCEKQKDAEHFESLQLRLSVIDLGNGASSCVVVPGEQNVRVPLALSKNRVTVLRALRESPVATIQFSQLRERTMIAERTLHRVVDELVEHGYVVRVPGKAGMYRLTESGTATATELPTDCHDRCQRRLPPLPAPL